MSVFEFIPLSPEAKELTINIMKGKFYAHLTAKLLCACLGPAGGADNYEYREACYAILKQEGHMPYYPESVDNALMLSVFDKENLSESRREIVLNSQEQRNLCLILNSDLVFVLATSQGPCFEFGLYRDKIPERLIILAPAGAIPVGSQTDMAIKSFQDEFPNSVVEFSGIEDLKTKIKKCIEREIRIRMRRDNQNGTKTKHF